MKTGTFVMQIRLEPASQDAICIGCGNFLRAGKKVDFLVSNADGLPQVGVHKACVEMVRARRGA